MEGWFLFLSGVFIETAQTQMVTQMDAKRDTDSISPSRTGIASLVMMFRIRCGRKYILWFFFCVEQLWFGNLCEGRIAKC